MMMQEFNKISRELGYFDIDPALYPEAERAYMAVEDLSKKEFVIIYWDHPGVYQALVSMSRCRPTYEDLHTICRRLSYMRRRLK